MNFISNTCSKFSFCDNFTCGYVVLEVIIHMLSCQFEKKTLTSLLDHLNGKTIFKKVGPPYDLLKGEETKVVSWIFGM